MDIAEYIKRNSAPKQTPPQNNPSPQEMLDKYSGYSEEELMRELFRYGSLSTGKISAKELDDFFKKVSPFLTPEQSERMKELIIKLKNS